MAQENYTNSALLMDRGLPIGNSEDVEGRRALHVKNVNGLLAGLTYDWFTVAYPSSTVEVYTFLTGGPSGVPVAQIELEYADSTKNELIAGGRL